MKSTVKKLLSVLLAAAVIFGSFAFGIADVDWSDFAIEAEAADAFYKGYYYTVDKNGNATITGSSETDLVIPSSISGYLVIAIKDSAFYNDYRITSVTIPNNEIKIGNEAFSGCSNLSKVTIGNGVKIIGDRAFFGCSKISSISIPNSVTTIGKEAFYGTSIATFTIPESVTDIGYNALLSQTVVSITVDFGNSSYSNDGYGVLFNKDKTELICYPAKNKRSTYIIPDTVTYISGCAFWGSSNLSDITIANRVKGISDYAFWSCTSLKKITIPDSVELIGDYAFAECSVLGKITITDTVSSIGVGAFEDTEYYNYLYNWEDKVLYVGNHLVAAEEDISGSYSVKSGTKTIAEKAFESCSYLTSVTFPDSLVDIGHSAFYKCTSLKNVNNISNKIIKINDSTFADCENLTAVTLPDDLEEIGIGAFSGCFALESLYIPLKMKNIDRYAFNGCSNIVAAYYPGTYEQWDSVAVETGNNELIKKLIFNCNTDKSHYYPQLCGESLTYILYTDGELEIIGFGEMTSYDFTDIPWYSKGSMIKKVTIDEGVTSICSFAFYNCKNITDVYYNGSAEEWAKVDIGYGNDPLKKANMHYNDSTEIPTKPITTEPASDFSTLPFENPVTKPTEPITKPIEVLTTMSTEPSATVPSVETATKPSVTEPSTTKPVEIPSTTKPIETPLTTKPAVEPTTKPVAEPTTIPDVQPTTKPVVEPTTKPVTPPVIHPKAEIKIKAPSTTTISYGDSIILHADIENLPEGAYIEWTADNGNFTYTASADGTTCTVSPSASGNTTFTATVVDANGEEISSDTQTMTAKAGLWQKIVSFFKNLFGISRIIEQVVKF